jgi:hypothetical protein
MAITKVTNSLVATNAIQGTLIADNAITSVHIAQNQVTSVQIPDSSITSTQLAANSVDTAELISGSIDAIHLASDSVTTAKILNANITTAKIANNAITSALIPDGSITDTQLGSGAFTMGTITTTGAIRGPASLTIDPATVGDNTGTVVIAGNLQVDGTTTTVNSTTVDIVDKNITLGKGGTASANNGGGITIDGANATLLYASSGDKFVFNKNIDILGTSSSALLKVGNNNGSVLYGVNTDGNAVVSGQTSSKDLIFEVNNDEKMRIHNSGKLGIGTDTTTPTGKVTIAYPSGNNAPNTITAANTYLQLGSEDYGPNNDGKFMIGFGYTDGTTNTHSPAYIGYEETSTSGDTKGNLTFYTRNVLTDTAPTKRMTIDSAGNVGIGNTNPQTNLTIGSAQGNSLEFTYDSTNGYRNIISNHWDSSTDTRMDFNIGRTANVAPTTVMSVGYGGRVGIGRTNPTQLLEVHKSTGGDQTVAKFSAHNYGDTGKTFIEIGTEYGDGSSRIGSFNDTGNKSVLVFDTHSATSGQFTEAMRINSSGDLIFNGSTNITSNTSDGSDNAQIVLAGGGSGADTRGASIHLAGNENGNGGLLQLRAGSGSVGGIRLYSGGGERMRINATGGLSINDDIETPLSITRTTTTTGASYMTFANAGGNAFVGVDSSAGNRMFVGGTSANAYALTLTTESTNPILFATNNAQRMRITSAGAVQILHGNTSYYTSFEDQNEINTYTTAGASSTMYLQHAGGDLNVGADVFILDRTNKRVKIRNSTYNSTNVPLFVSNGTEGPGALYDTVVISQNDVPCIRLDETATGQELTLAVGNENSNNAVIGSTGKITLATNRTGGTAGYAVSNGMVVIDTNQVLMNTHLEIKTTDDQILTLNQNDTGAWNYIGYETQNVRKWYLGMNQGSNFVIGSDVAGKTVELVNADLKAPGVIVQTVRASVENVVGTGNFDIVSVNITPKFANSDMIIHFYTQWSVETNNGEDWGLQLQRDGTAILGDSQSSYFISGGGVDASDYASQFSTAAKYYVRTASKMDIDTGRSSSTSQMTYKIRKVVPAGSSTKTVRFGVDGWTGGGVESQRSLNVLIVQEVQPN